MPINQNRATPGLMFVACPNDGMPARGNKLCLQTNTGEFFHQPSCALLQFLLVLIVRRDTWKTQEGIILLEVIFTHGQKLIGFRSLSTLSVEPGRVRDKRLMKQPPLLH